MSRDYIVYKCLVCGKEFVLQKKDVEHSEHESKYLTCPFHGKHKKIIVTGTYDDIGKCMDHDSYKKRSGAIKQTGWSR